MDVHQLCASRGFITVQLEVKSTIVVVVVLVGHGGWY